MGFLGLGTSCNVVNGSGVTTCRCLSAFSCQTGGLCTFKAAPSLIRDIFTAASTGPLMA